MGKKIYVGNLPFSADDQFLEGLFSPFGAVESAKVIMDRETGRSKGFGFVEMTQDDEAMKAIEELDSSDAGGRSIRVNEAKPREGGGGFRGGKGGRGGGGGGGRRF